MPQTQHQAALSHLMYASWKANKDTMKIRHQYALYGVKRVQNFIVREIKEKKDFIDV